MAEPTIAHWRKYGKYEAFKFWTHPPVKPQCTVHTTDSILAYRVNLNLYAGGHCSVYLGQEEAGA